MFGFYVVPGSMNSFRFLTLFTFGCSLAAVLMTFQYEHKLLLSNSPSLMLTLPSLVLISACGFAAGKFRLVFLENVSFLRTFFFFQRSSVRFIPFSSDLWIERNFSRITTKFHKNLSSANLWFCSSE